MACGIEISEKTTIKKFQDHCSAGLREGSFHEINSLLGKLGKVVKQLELESCNQLLTAAN